ncbi:MAG: TonB-dependent receptor [Gemmatimonadaceae bacterium]|nr:TonB-dependent receptor [Gemmatimonadaceae bacterium]
MASVSLLAAPALAQAVGGTVPDTSTRATADSTARARVPLAQVTVIGTVPGALRGIPGAAVTVPLGQLQVLAPLSIKEAMRTVPGVHVVDEDAFGLNLNIGVRGLPPRRSSRVLLLEDGMPIHLGPYADPSSHYHPPVDALERVEVVKGSAQIAFGPQTTGGVINFVRRAPPVRPEVRLALQGGARDLAMGRLSAGGTWNGVGLLVSAARREGDGTRVGQHHRVQELSLRGTMPVPGSQQLSLSGGLYREASRYGEAGLSQEEFDADPYQNPLPNDVFDLTRQSLQLVHDAALPGAAALRTQVYGQRIVRTAWRQGSTSADRFGTGSYATTFRCQAGATSVDQCGNTGRPREYAFAGIEPRLTLPHAVGGFPATLETGVRWHEERIERREINGTTANARSGTLVRDNGIDLRAFSAFAREQIRAGRVTLTPGVRIEQVRAVNRNEIADTRNADRYTEVLPGVGASWSSTPSATDAPLTIMAGLHRGFAPPRPADILNPVPGQGIVQVDAEVSWTSEFGARWRPTDAVRFDATAFRLDYDNQIITGSLVGSAQRFVNGGRTLHQGLEVGTSVLLDRLWSRRRGAGTVTADVAWTWLPTARFTDDRTSTIDATQTVLGRRLPFAPRHVVNLGIGVESGSGASVRINGDVVASQFADDLNTVLPSAQGRRGRLPGYAVFNASARVPLRPIGRGAVASVSVKNIANRVYITDRQEGIMTGMPRLVSAGLEVVY